eukprot:366217-Chlamydomonas_euryale.AAC.2
MHSRATRWPSHSPLLHSLRTWSQAPPPRPTASVDVARVLGRASAPPRNAVTLPPQNLSIAKKHVLPGSDLRGQQHSLDTRRMAEVVLSPPLKPTISFSNPHRLIFYFLSSYPLASTPYSLSAPAGARRRPLSHPRSRSVSFSLRILSLQVSRVSRVAFCLSPSHVFSPAPLPYLSLVHSPGVGQVPGCGAGPRVWGRSNRVWGRSNRVLFISSLVHSPGVGQVPGCGAGPTGCGAGPTGSYLSRLLFTPRVWGRSPGVGQVQTGPIYLISCSLPPNCFSLLLFSPVAGPGARS